MQKTRDRLLFAISRYGDMLVADEAIKKLEPEQRNKLQAQILNLIDFINELPGGSNWYTWTMGQNTHTLPELNKDNGPRFVDEIQPTAYISSSGEIVFNREEFSKLSGADRYQFLKAFVTAARRAQEAIFPEKGIFFDFDNVRIIYRPIDQGQTTQRVHLPSGMVIELDEFKLELLRRYSREGAIPYEEVERRSKQWWRPTVLKVRFSQWRKKK